MKAKGIHLTDEILPRLHPQKMANSSSFISHCWGNSEGWSSGNGWDCASHSERLILEKGTWLFSVGRQPFILVLARYVCVLDDKLNNTAAVLWDHHVPHLLQLHHPVESQEKGKGSGGKRESLASESLALWGLFFKYFKFVYTGCHQDDRKSHLSLTRVYAQCSNFISLITILREHCILGDRYREDFLLFFSFDD